MFKWKIGYATSTDLAGPWTKGGSVILDTTTGSWDNRYVGSPFVLYDSLDGKYEMWYMGGQTSWWGSIGYATATVLTRDTIEVPADYATIQAGIDAAKDGDFVAVSEGTYFENIRFRGKKITVGSQFVIDGDTSHISKTIIDGSHSTDPDSGSTVYLVSDEDTNSVLCGFTITGGTGTNVGWGFMPPATNDRDGGGIYATSGARISHNIIAYNTVNQTTANGAYGGGITCGRNAIVEYNDINHNTIQSQVFQAGSGGILILGSNTRLIKNSITDNTAQTNASGWNSCGGGVGVSFRYSESSGALVAGNLIARNKALAPNCIYPCWGGGLVSYSMTKGSEIINNTVVDNIAEGKTASRGGGICVYNGDDQLVKNNVVARNSAGAGGGVACYTEIIVSRPPTIMNNTIVYNRTTGTSGSGIYISTAWTPIVQNTIVWGNIGGSEIFGVANIQYCDVEGGYLGNGNINVNPGFVDTVNYYLRDTSKCVDVGNPDSIFNDIADPTRPGYALSPALGTIRNDIGAYGGDPNSNVRVLTPIPGPKFSAFVNRVNLAALAGRQAIVDSFMNATSSYPFIEQDTIIYYLYHGNANSVTVPGDANNWSTEAALMTNLYGTNLWYYEAVYEPDARLDYQFYLDGKTWMLDPLNTHQIPGPYGPNSELAMPDYVQPPEIQYDPNIPHGTAQSLCSVPEFPQPIQSHYDYSV